MFKKKKSKMELAQEKAEQAIEKTNERIGALGEETGELYEVLNDIQSQFDAIRNIPVEKQIEYKKLKEIRLNWKQQAEKIEKDYKNANAKNMGAGAAGVGAGVAVAALGPTAAMGIATTFGVASTGTAISTLSGAAATNAALAWLGGGALAAGGGGMAAGEAFLALAGPVGWAIAGVALVGSGILFFKGKNDKKRLEDIFTCISERDVKSYELAIVEINERISRIIDENQKLRDALENVKSFGLDYTKMSEEQQYELGACVNLMNASTQLLVNPILGLQPKYTMQDYERYINTVEAKPDTKTQEVEVSLANLLYKIDMDEKDQKLLCKSLKKNKKFLESIDFKKKEFDLEIIKTVDKALNFKYAEMQ